MKNLFEMICITEDAIVTYIIAPIIGNNIIAFNKKAMTVIVSNNADMPDSPFINLAGGKLNHKNTNKAPTITKHNVAISKDSLSIAITPKAV